MDPNATLDDIRSALTDWQHSEDGSAEETDAVGVFVDRFRDLDHWLSRGGFLPAEWNRKA